MGVSRQKQQNDVLAALSALQQQDGVKAVASAIVGRRSSLSPPRLIDVQAVGPAGLVARLRRLDGARLIDAVHCPLPWRLNRPWELHAEDWPVRPAEHLYASNGIGSAHCMIIAERGLYVGWLVWFQEGRNATLGAAAMATVRAVVRAVQNRHVLCPVNAVSTLSIAGRRPTAVCDVGRRWLTLPGSSRAIMRAARTAPAPSWYRGARITFDGQSPCLTATLTPFRPADVLAVGQLSREERVVLAAYSAGQSAAQIGQTHGVSEALVNRLLEAGSTYHPLGQMVRDAWASPADVCTRVSDDNSDDKAR